MKLFFAACLLMLVFAGVFTEGTMAIERTQREKVLLDTDIGTDVDDALALVLLARSPNVELKLVTTVGAKADVRALIAKRLLASMKIGNVPVAPGLSRPLASTRFQQPFPNGLWLGHEGKGILTDDEIKSASQSTNAVDEIISTLLKSKAKLTVITIGPVTNFGAALQKEPRIAAKIKRFVVMGGNVLRPAQFGGRELSPMMEFNLNADREAASILFSSGVPITLVPVELTIQSYLTREDGRVLLNGDRTAQTLGKLIAIWTPVFHHIYASFNLPESSYSNIACHLHDVLAVAAVVQPKLIKFRDVQITAQEEAGVFVTPAKTDGKIRVTVAEQANNDEVKRVLIKAMNHTESYQLIPKYRAGEKDYFSYDLRFNRIGPGGKLLGKNVVKGYFTQEVIDLRPDGAPTFRITRNHTKLTITDENGKELISRVLGFGEGLSYKVCFEDPFDFYPVDTTEWPRDIMGFMMFEQVYTSGQFFQTIVTRTHGAVDQLVQPGAKVLMPDSNRTGTLALEGLANMEITRGESSLTFLGVGAYQNRKAAVLFFELPYLLDIHELLGNKNGRGKEFLQGFIWVSPDDGKILGGRLQGSNFIAFPDATGKLQPSDVVVDGRLERLTAQEYEAQTR